MKQPPTFSLNQKVLSRIYPAGLRTNSSNMDPVIAWACGAQLVALNFQTSDPPMFLNACKFMENGGTGFVMKPPHLLANPNEMPMAPIQLTVQVSHLPFHGNPCQLLFFGVWICHRLGEAGLVACFHAVCHDPRILSVWQVLSAQRLPKLGTAKDIIDPYVVIEIVGTTEDRAKKNTKTVQNNGWNPTYGDGKGETFIFDIITPDAAMIMITVWDEVFFQPGFPHSLLFDVQFACAARIGMGADPSIVQDVGRDDFVGCFACPVPHIRCGVRHVPLLDAHLTPLLKAGVLCSFNIKQTGVGESAYKKVIVATLSLWEDVTCLALASGFNIPPWSCLLWHSHHWHDPPLA